MRLLLDHGKIISIEGPADITEQSTDAIVNAANSSLLGGGGVDGAIHDAGGPAILAECRQIVSKIGRLHAGQAVMTTGGNLNAKFVIHTVGPSCHRESIRLADEHALTSVAFPAISTGAYGYPPQEAAPIAITSTVEALRMAKNMVTCRFVLFDISTVRAFESAAEKLHRTNPASPFRIEKA
jgi:O-acetyl-ADP-ribose deacetylase (regulator of RNase III)